MLLFIDTETTGLWLRDRPTAHPLQPWLVQLAMILCDSGEVIEQHTHIIKPDGWSIPQRARTIHGITTEYASAFGEPLDPVIQRLLALAERSKMIIAHNIEFDDHVVDASITRCGLDIDLTTWHRPRRFCTMTSLTQHTQIPFESGRGYSRRYKWPSLTEAWEHLFPGIPPVAEGPRHSAMGDCMMTRSIYLAGHDRGYW